MLQDLIPTQHTDDFRRVFRVAQMLAVGHTVTSKQHKKGLGPCIGLYRCL